MEIKDYKTTYSKEVELKMADYISASFLQEIAQMIAQRVPMGESVVKLSLSTEIGADFETSTQAAVEKILGESRKYQRAIKTIFIKTDILHKTQNNGTHYLVELRIQRINDKFCGFLRVYAVAGEVADSQHVIDWGSGLIKDFANLNINEEELAQDSLIIDAKDGMVRGWTKEERLEHDMPQKVEVVNVVETSPTKWSDKSIILAIGGIAATAIIAVVSWLFFSGGSS